MPNTTAVTVNLTLNTTLVTQPPYNIASVGGTIAYDDGTSSTFTGWNAEGVGTPQPSGASFSLNVMDAGYSVNQTSIGNWALTFIPRGYAPQASPFGNNVNTIAGNGGTGTNGNFSLNLGNPNPKIKNAGSWDWTLMVQITFPNGQIHCFASDPEMDVNP